MPVQGTDQSYKVTAMGGNTLSMKYGGGAGCLASISGCCKSLFTNFRCPPAVSGSNLFFGGSSVRVYRPLLANLLPLQRWAGNFGLLWRPVCIRSNWGFGGCFYQPVVRYDALAERQSSQRNVHLYGRRHPDHPLDVVDKGQPDFHCLRYSDQYLVFAGNASRYRPDGANDSQVWLEKSRRRYGSIRDGKINVQDDEPDGF